jgi:hypothetical protein
VIRIEQIAAEGDGQGQFAAAQGAAEHQRMRQTVFPDHLHQPLLGFLLSYHLTKLHFLYYF